MSSPVSEDPDLFSSMLAADAGDPAPVGGQPWKVLVVDDEADVHAVLRLALQEVAIEGRGLQLLDAFSAEQAKEVLAANPDIALILLDVVMESERAGLDLVRHVRDREQLANRTVQIVLITGQPGYAPQREVISQYEIDGYRLKSELHGNQIFAQVHSALRTYRLMREQEQLQHDLELKVRQLDAAVSALRESQANFIRAQSVAHVGSWNYELASDEMHLSPETCRLFGLPEGTVGSYQSYLGRVCSDDRAALEAAWQRFLQLGGSFEHEHRILIGNAVRYVRHRADLTFDADGKPLRSLGTTQDITERKQAEAELRRSNAELEQYSYAISHDLRQPLRMIASYLQLLGTSLADQLNEEQSAYFGFAIDGAKRLDRMLVALLEYSRVGRLGEPPAWIESRVVLDEALLFLQPAIAEAGATINICGEWPRVFVRPDEMLRLLQNLIANAVKFRVPGRQPQVTVISRIVAAEWCLVVADNGVGIAPAQLGRLFQVFQRLQSRAAFEGSGVGLALCRKIAEHHGGRIWVESGGEGRGSRFCVAVPMPGKTP
ncbi:MAG: Phytochrome-like protein cph1 [Accumulibacter sp.]|uniref:sensor histidine kinase n=1 Tax=Accumulibacter sp. TaxID=2053492 RepID=UPI0012205DF1|nr:ATP-binding protein [Accumulibacter sp.]QKS30304.1 MAG: PAS domain-containing protein [Candidatus Accumulibacter similis]TLD46740.1 MAG: Phytochrome-like protein cph1 [Accumulibacter sp.]